MAASKSNRSVKNKQSVHGRPGSSTLSPRHAGVFDIQHSATRSKTKKGQSAHPKSSWLRKVLRFPQAKSKIVESVEFSTELGYHSISINFTDKTSLNFAIDASFTVETDYSKWKTGTLQPSALPIWSHVRRSVRLSSSSK